MKNYTILVTACALLASVESQAAAKVVQLSDLPDPVKAQVVKYSEGGTIKLLEEKNKNGGVEYEAEIIKNGMGLDVGIAADGTVFEVEHEIRYKEIPANLRGIARQEAAGEVFKCEKVLKNGKEFYEIFVLKGTEITEVKITPEGEIFKVQKKQLPAAVTDTAKKLAAGGKVDSYEIEKDALGHFTYEAEIELGDREFEVKIDKAGKVLSKESKSSTWTPSGSKISRTSLSLCSFEVASNISISLNP